MIITKILTIKNSHNIDDPVIFFSDLINFDEFS